MKITASEVNKLRQSTGAGMMDCKKALVEAEGDFDKAVENLRKKGQKVAANRADRDSSEGAALAKVNDDHTAGVLISVNCETDFVAKNDSYLELAHALADHALTFDTKDAFLSSEFQGMTVAEKLTEQTGVIGEKIEIGGFTKLTAPFVGSYIHAGNKIATLVGLSGIVENAAEIAKDQLRQEGKPEAMLDNIAKGKIKRFFKDNTLVNQAYIKDGKISVAEYVKSADADLVVTGFGRVALG